jgi:NADPH-dependent glutamate synthase beta subunit-like oxidoreductase
MGFDHIALCMGAGKPTVLDIPNGLARGVRQASDFLMALQLTGAAKTSIDRQSAIALPVVVIGGGLTAIDTATESSPTTFARWKNSRRATRRWWRRGNVKVRAAGGRRARNRR